MSRARGDDKFVSYFNEEGRQLRPLPKKWTDLSRFKVGDKIECLRSETVHFPCDECKEKSYFHYNNANADRCEHRSMLGIVGVVEEIRPAYGEYPSRQIDTGDGEPFWSSQHEACLVVRYPFDNYGKDKDGRFKPRCAHLSDEGVTWRKVK